MSLLNKINKSSDLKQFEPVQLKALADEEPDIASLVEMRYFAGLTLGEAAASLGISDRTADRHWAYAKAWLHQALGDESGN